MQRSLCMTRRAIGVMALGCAFLAAPSGTLGPEPARAETSAQDLAAKIAVYRQKLAAYKKMRGDYDRRAAPYWHRISEKRSERRSKLAHNRPPHAQRLRAGAAAALHRPAGAGEPRAEEGPAQAHPRRRRLSAQR